MIGPTGVGAAAASWAMLPLRTPVAQGSPQRVIVAQFARRRCDRYASPCSIGPASRLRPDGFPSAGPDAGRHGDDRGGRAASWFSSPGPEGRTPVHRARAASCRRPVPQPGRIRPVGGGFARMPQQLRRLRLYPRRAAPRDEPVRGPGPRRPIAAARCCRPGGPRRAAVPRQARAGLVATPHGATALSVSPPPGPVAGRGGFDARRCRDPPVRGRVGPLAARWPEGACARRLEVHRRCGIPVRARDGVCRSAQRRRCAHAGRGGGYYTAGALGHATPPGAPLACPAPGSPAWPLPGSPSCTAGGTGGATAAATTGRPGGGTAPIRRM